MFLVRYHCFSPSSVFLVWMANQWFTANEIFLLSGLKHDWGRGSKLEGRRAWQSLLCFLILHCSTEKQALEMAILWWLTPHTNLSSHTLPFTVVGFSSQVCQWSCWQQIRAVKAFLCRQHHLSGEEKGSSELLWAVPDRRTVSQLVCLSSDHFQYLFNCVIHRVTWLSSSPTTLIFKYLFP